MFLPSHRYVELSIFVECSLYTSQFLFIKYFSSFFLNFSPEQNLYLTFSRLRRLHNLPFLHIPMCRLTRNFHLPRLKKLNELYPIFYHGELAINYVSQWKIIPIFSFLNFDFLITRLSLSLAFPFTFTSAPRSSQWQQHLWSNTPKKTRKIV